MRGFYKPKNPNKYRGDVSHIRYLSSWEFRFMIYLDDHKDILEWSSEEIRVSYISPIDNKRHIYLPDFAYTKINNSGQKEILMVEIKPLKQTVPPKKQKKITKKYLTEVRTWGINEAKFKAAKEFCKKRGWKFLVFTEVDLGINSKKRQF